MTVKTFIASNPNCTLSLMTPNGYVTVTPECGERLLHGGETYAHAGTSEAWMDLPAEHLLSQEIIRIYPHGTIPNFYIGISDYPKLEVQESHLKMTQQLGGMKL